MQQLEELFEVEMIEDLEKDELNDLDLLLIIHPKTLSEPALFSVDQYVLSGGKLLAFVDPLAELDQPGPGAPGVPSKSSDLNAITKKWGVVLREQKILGDPEVALLVSRWKTSTAFRDFGFLSRVLRPRQRRNLVNRDREHGNSRYF